MKLKSSLFLRAGFGLLLAAVPLIAHHSVAAQYDFNKRTTLTGPITKVEWINPHARIYIDVKDATGKVVNHEVELGAPAILTRNGWKRSDVKIGETVTVSGPIAKDGSKLVLANTITLANGQRIFGGAPPEAEPNR